MHVIASACIRACRAARDGLAELIVAALAAKQSAFVIVNNKAEGSASLSIVKLAKEIAARLPG